MNDKLLNFLGIARRSGSLVLGFDKVCESVEKGKASLVMTAQDTSQNTYKALMKSINGTNSEHITICRTKDEISFAVGKNTSVMSINDDGFIKKIKELNKPLQTDIH